MACLSLSHKKLDVMTAIGAMEIMKCVMCRVIRPVQNRPDFGHVRADFIFGLGLLLNTLVKNK